MKKNMILLVVGVALVSLLIGIPVVTNTHNKLTSTQWMVQDIDAVVEIRKIFDDFQGIVDKCFVHFFIGIAELNAADSDPFAVDLHIIFRMFFGKNFFGQPAGTHIVAAAEFDEHTVIGVAAAELRFIGAGQIVDAMTDTVIKKCFVTLGNFCVGEPGTQTENGIVNVIFDLKCEIFVKGEVRLFLVGAHPDKIGVLQK